MLGSLWKLKKMLDHSSPLLGCSSFLNCLKLLAILLQPKLMQNHGWWSKVDQWVLQLLRCRRISSSRQKYILARKKDFTSQEVYSCKEKKTSALKKCWSQDWHWPPLFLDFQCCYQGRPHHAAACWVCHCIILEWLGAT